MDGLLREFLLDVTEALDAFHVELCRFERNLKDARTLTGIFRQLHTIKGAAGFLALRRLEALAHAAESLVGRLRDGGRATRAAIKLLFCTSVRIRELILVLEREGHEPEGDDRDLLGSLERTARVRGGRQSRAGAEVKAPRFIWGTESGYDLRSDAPIHSAAHSLCGDGPSLAHLSAIVGELGIAGGELTEIAGRIDDDDLKMRLQDLAGIVAALQSAVTRARTQPVRNAWRALPRIVRELGVRLGKDIQVEILGGETELDRRVLDVVKEPLLHLARNAADHGLETREERRARAKPETGVIRFSATCAADHATIAVSDDGRGLIPKDPAHAIASGLAERSEVDGMSDDTLHDFVFAPGFSTAIEVTTLSGRGMGLDIARTNIVRAGGSIEVSSIPGKGTTFIMKLPLRDFEAGLPRFATRAQNESVGMGQPFCTQTNDFRCRPLQSEFGSETRDRAIENAA